MPLKQYLQRYAETEINVAAKLLDFLHTASSCSQTPYYQHVVTIPAFNEADSLIERIAQLNNSESVLVILVLNAPDHNHTDVARKQTQALSQGFKRHYQILKQLSATAHLLALDSSLDQHLLLLERCHKDSYIPYKEGVGLARKIGCDIACQLIHDKVISSPWIHSTDADVSLPKNYFTSTQELNSKKTAVALYPFIHQPNLDPLLNLAQRLYELSLYYYVEGLSWADSPYSFHTIGSTLVINHRSYASCRGFPKRAAGEDFYLLNKMAKVGKVLSLNSPTLRIDSRLSDRVPFGTGPALSKISQLTKPYQQYQYYHPDCFYYLQQWLSLLPVLWELLRQNEIPNEAQDFVMSTLSTALATLPPSKLDHKLLYQCLQSLQIASALKHAKQQSKSKATFLRHMHNWFDAFKTLKFIHFLRENGLNSINATALMTQADFISVHLRKEFRALSIQDNLVD